LLGKHTARETIRHLRRGLPDNLRRASGRPVTAK
jgi:hypothetical protein